MSAETELHVDAPSICLHTEGNCFIQNTKQTYENPENIMLGYKPVDPNAAPRNPLTPSKICPQSYNPGALHRIN